MSGLSIQVGATLRNFRKARHLTLEELANEIGKQKSTVSKYEKGEIILDLDTLYRLADVLHIQPQQLLPIPPEVHTESKDWLSPSFFHGINRLYAYFFDGRINKIVRCVFDIMPPEQDSNKCRTMMYMNFTDYQNYQNCETRYSGYVEHYDAITQFQLINQDTAMERATLQVLATYLNASTKWGLWTGLSSRPVMPTAAKMLLSPDILPEDKSLTQKLKISKEDIRLLKLYNMMVVI